MMSLYKRSKDILGLNARSFVYTKPYNLKPARRIADSKLSSKKVLEDVGVPTPKTYAVIRSRQELHDLDINSLPKSFVIKPDHGFSGEGIKVVYGRKKNGNWVGPENKEYTEENIRFHINDILEGTYSLTHAPDIAFLEQRLRVHSDLKIYAYKGVPDVRIIVFNKVPIMAMLRLPTKLSGGRANLATGGIGVGIDISNGITTHAVMKSSFMREKSLDYLPGTRSPLRGIQIPYWNEMLEMAIVASNASGLGYAGVDIALDRDAGPMIFEVNARPGLSIQNANNKTLGDRLRRVKGLKVKTPKKGIRLAKELFGGTIEQEISEISGKEVIGLSQKVIIESKAGQEIEVLAKVDTGAVSSSIDRSLAIELGFGDALEYADQNGLGKVNILAHKHIEREVARRYGKELAQKLTEHEDIENVTVIYSSHGISVRMKVKLTFHLAGRVITTKVNIVDRGHLKYKILLGKNDLKYFFIDPTK